MSKVTKLSEAWLLAAEEMEKMFWPFFCKAIDGLRWRVSVKTIRKMEAKIREQLPNARTLVVQNSYDNREMPAPSTIFEDKTARVMLALVFAAEAEANENSR